MRALAVIVTLAVWTCRVHATDHDPLLARAVNLLHISDQSPLYNFIECSNNLGPTKCISALSTWRATNALESLELGRAADFNIVRDVKQFPWEKYSNTSQDQIYDHLCADTVKLLKYRSLELSLPGYGLELDAANGTLHVDLIENDEGTQVTGRGAMKKLMKQFYDIVPLLILPGLLMSAVLPFILPGLKMMTVLVGMINNMALSGAVFTLLRNNAFNDHYEKKIIYVNDGYKNEKQSDFFFKDSFRDTFKSSFKDIPLDNVELQFSPSEMHSVMAADSSGDNIFFDSIKPSDEQWLKDYYGAQDMSGIPLKNRRSHDEQSNEQQQQLQQQQKLQQQQEQQQQLQQQQLQQQQLQQEQQMGWDPVNNAASDNPTM